MPVATATLRTWLSAALVSALLPGGALAQGQAEPESTTLPGSLASLVAATALDPDTPRARVLLDVIRQAHAAPPGSSPEVDAARLRLDAWLAATTQASPGETVPLPFAATVWRRLALEGGAATGDPAQFILGDRRAALVYTGAMALDAGTRAWLATQPDVLRRLYQDHAGPFAAFGRTLRVVDGALALPGSPESQRLIEALVGERRGEPAAFTLRALGRDHGRLAYFLDTVAHLDAPRQRLALAEDVADREERENRVRALLRLCLEWAPAWRVAERPFTRPLTDPATVLGELLVTPRGQLVPPGSTAAWDAAFGSGAVPGASATWSRKAAAAPAPDITWLTAHILSGDVRAARERLGAVLFAQRTFGDRPDTPPAVLAVVGRGFIAQRSLVLTLHRLGVRDAGTYAAALDVAARLPGDGGAPRARLALFQAALALLDRAHHTGGLGAGAAAAQLSALLGTFRTARDTADRWLATEWLPALSGAPTADAVEAPLLARLAGAEPEAAEAANGTAPATYTWEGAHYHVSPERATQVRLASVRARQAGNRLDAVLAFVGAAGDLVVTGSRDALLAGCRAALAHAEALDAIPWPDIESAALVRPESVAREACERAERVRGGAAGPREAERMLEPLRTLSAVALADVLTAVVYAPHAGDPDGAIDLAPDLARRHLYDLDVSGRPGQPRGPWSLPEEARAPGTGWHVRGSLLLLEHALASHVLRRLAGAGMPPPPTLPGDEQRTLTLTVALMSPHVLGDAARDHLVAATSAGCAAVDAGRNDPDTLLALADRLGWAGTRREVLAWAARHEPEAVPGLFSAAECYALGVRAGSPVPNLDAWGAASLPDDGQLRLAWPSWGWEEVTGRSPGGLLTTRFVDLTLRAAAALAEAGLPARLLPSVLAAAVSDLIDEARLGHVDDFPALSAHVRRLSPERLADYLAALGAGGPLVPLEEPGDGVER